MSNIISTNSRTKEIVMDLNSKLDLVTQQFAHSAPPEVVGILEQNIAELASSGLTESALKVGSEMSDFALPDATGSIVHSSELRARGPLVVTFYRGTWCPYCNLELRELQLRLNDIRDRGATLVAISPQKPDGSLNDVEISALGFPLLSDVGNGVARTFGLVFKLDPRSRHLYEQLGVHIDRLNGDDSFELPVPATYVVDRDGEVKGAFVDVDYRRRASPDDVLGWLDRTG